MSSIPRPINSRGATKKRWQAAEDAGHAAVLARVRARRGICEAPGCDLPAAEDAHMFSRGRVAMSAPWCHAPELRRGLCRGHHKGVDGNVLMELRDAMRWQALAEFMAAENLVLTAGHGITWGEGDPLDVAHEIDRAMHEKYPDPEVWWEERRR